jgi:hypothetical protein
MADAQHWIRKLGLKRHSEGGWYRETYRSPDYLPSSSLPERYIGRRPYGTAIYFLLGAHEVSRFHRLQSDELWHFYDGTGLTLHLLLPDGSHTAARLGDRDSRNGRFQTIVPRGVWMGALVEDPGGYALAGCTVAPGFEFNDFELGSRPDLLAQYPRHRKLIERLTNPA